MKIYDKYVRFFEDLKRASFPEPFWCGFSGTILDHVDQLTPKEVKRLVKTQFHADKTYPLWWIGDSVQGGIPDSWDGYEAATERNYKDYCAFVKGMAILFKKHAIAPKGWIKWYTSHIE